MASPHSGMHTHWDILSESWYQMLNLCGGIRKVTPCNRSHMGSLFRKEAEDTVEGKRGGERERERERTCEAIRGRVQMPALLVGIAVFHCSLVSLGVSVTFQGSLRAVMKAAEPGPQSVASQSCCSCFSLGKWLQWGEAVEAARVQRCEEWLSGTGILCRMQVRCAWGATFGF